MQNAKEIVGRILVFSTLKVCVDMSKLTNRENETQRTV